MNSKARRVTQRRFILLMLAAAAVLAACASADDVYLPALLADPMAEYAHPSLEVEARVEQPEGRQALWGAAQHAQVLTGFVLSGSEEPVIADILDTAEAAGWVFAPDSPISEGGNTDWFAEKELPEGLALISISSRLRSSLRNYDIGISLEFAEENE